MARELPMFIRRRQMLLGAAPACLWLLWLFASDAFLSLSSRASITISVVFVVCNLTCLICLFGSRRRVRRRIIAARGAMCFGCGYDLAGLAQIGACPECGEAYVLEALRERWAASGLCTRGELA